MSESLTILANDNIILRNHVEQMKTNLITPKKGKINQTGISDELTVLKQEVFRLTQIEDSCDESVLLYENTIKDMNKKMKESLKKESERRKKAEFDVQRLKQKN